MSRRSRPRSSQAIALSDVAQAKHYAQARDAVLRRLNPVELAQFAAQHAGLVVTHPDQALAMAHRARLCSNAFTNGEKTVSQLWLSAHSFEPE